MALWSTASKDAAPEPPSGLSSLPKHPRPIEGDDVETAPRTSLRGARKLRKPKDNDLVTTSPSDPSPADPQEATPQLPSLAADRTGEDVQPESTLDQPHDDVEVADQNEAGAAQHRLRDLLAAPTTAARRTGDGARALTTRALTLATQRPPRAGHAAETARQDGTPWALESVVNHLTFTKQRMIAWYLADPQQWSFRPTAEGEQLIEANAGQLAELVGSTVFIRRTSRPWPMSAWAKASWRNSPDPGAAYAEILKRDQRLLQSQQQADTLTYYGVDLGTRPPLTRVLAKVHEAVADREMRALQARLDHLDAIMAGDGLSARPALGADMAWLLARSFALGCPVRHDREVTPAEWTREDLAKFIDGVDWSAEPLAPTITITSTLGDQPVTRHVVTLTVGQMQELAIPEGYDPWMARVDRLPFPVEWTARIDVRTPEQTSKEMEKLSDRIDAQVNHYQQDHGKRPPKQLARQFHRTGEVEDEMRTGFDGLSTRTRGWYRLHVSGRTEEEALKRAEAVRNLYKPNINIEQELGQYQLAREAVPGEPLANTGHTRRLPVLKVAAAVPAATAEVGDKRGVLIGETAGFVSRAVVHDLWLGPEVLDQSGLCLIAAAPGGGKSNLMGLLIAKTCAQGVPWTVMDPSGRLGQLCALPWFRGISKQINLLRSEAGSLNPYALVPEPKREWFTDEDDPEKSYRDAVTAAQMTRRDLTFDTLRWCLDPSQARDGEMRTALRDAIGKAPATIHSSAHGVLEVLRPRKGVYKTSGAVLFRRLEEASQRELARLFFAPPEGTGSTHSEETQQPRLKVYNLKGLVQPEEQKEQDDWSFEELLSRPIMNLAAWSSASDLYRGDIHSRKGFSLDEAHEVTKVGTGKALVGKVQTDSRKFDIAALVATQNPSRLLGEGAANLVGSAFVGRTLDLDEQRDALKMLRLPAGVGYEAILGGLSPKSSRTRRPADDFEGENEWLNRSTPAAANYKEFIFADGMGGENGQGGIEKIRVLLTHHPELLQALDTRSDPTRAAAARRRAAQDRETIDLTKAEESAAGGASLTTGEETW
ncbi:ATP-binding protein [Kineococcus endophyticus]